jgi:hypothetical protein
VYHDANGNGQVESQDVLLAVTGVRHVRDAVTLPFTAPLDLAPTSTAHLLVTLRLVRSDVAAPNAAPKRSGWLLVAPVTFGLVLLPWWRRRTGRVIVGLLIVGLGCGLTLMSCVDGGGDALTFTVVLPAQGVTAQGEISGPLAGPAAPLTGATVSILPL